jgi:hypothetical protein
MERLIRVRDLKKQPGGFKVFLDLPDILPALEPDAHAWTWALRRVPELMAFDGWDFNLPVLGQQIEAERRGLTMTFEELQRFARRVHQVIWGEFIAAQSLAALPLRTSDAATVGQRAVAGLAAIDSTYWLVGGPTHIIDRVAGRFDAVDDISVDDWLRSDD